MELLHLVGEVPEGIWAVFSTPEDGGRGMVSVLVPRTLWRWMMAFDPFTSEQAWVERVGRHAVARAWSGGTGPSLVVVGAEDLDQDGGEPSNWQVHWGPVLRRCSGCGQEIPTGEVLEAIKNAMPPDEQGAVRIAVLCPHCRTATSHTLTPFGLRRGPATFRSAPSAPAE